MNEWIYILEVMRLGMLTDRASDVENEIVGKHFAYLQENLRTKKAILMGRTQNNDKDTFGVVIFRASNEEDARVFMQNDPAVKNKVMSAELFPYRIALMEGRGN